MKRITAIVLLSLSFAAQAQEAKVKKDHHLRAKVLTVVAAAATVAVLAVVVKEAAGSSSNYQYNPPPARVIHGVIH